jgi:4-hydroxybenzoate polyprenyltransferase
MPPLLQALRPRQWTKNLVVFAALAFSGGATDLSTVLQAGLVFALFCAASSGVYLFNDLLDFERDQLHPVKCKRAIARGALSKKVAAGASLALTAGALLVALLYSSGADAILAYLILQLGYTLRLKHVVILDVFCIAAGFLLRVLAGVWAIEAPLSPWLVACTVQLALFLALCKRRAEVVAVGTGSTAQRPLLEEYAGPGTDVMVGVSAAALLVTYTLYTLLPGKLLDGDLLDGALLQLDVTMKSQAGEPGMIWTVPFVLYGVMRYLYLVYRQEQGERPERILTGDLPLLLNILAYCAVVGSVVYL